MNFFKRFSNGLFLCSIITSFNVQTHYVEDISLVEEIILLDDFYKALHTQEPTVIKLYSKHCPHCKTFEKPFQEAAHKYKGKVIFYTLDGKALNAPKIVSEVTSDQGKNLKIPGYPTILYIKDGKIVDHMIGGNPKTNAEKIKKLIA